MVDTNIQTKKYVFDYEGFRRDIILKRMVDNRLSLNKAADEMGVGKATLSRVEVGNKFDMETFAAILGWLDQTPETYFLIK